MVHLLYNMECSIILMQVVKRLMYTSSMKVGKFHVDKTAIQSGGLNEYVPGQTAI